MGCIVSYILLMAGMCLFIHMQVSPTYYVGIWISDGALNQVSRIPSGSNFNSVTYKVKAKSPQEAISEAYGLFADQADMLRGKSMDRIDKEKE